MAKQMWDTLLLTLSTDTEGIGCVRIMYDKDELEPEYNLTRERTFDRRTADLPEIVAMRCSNLEFEFRIHYDGEKNPGRTFTLHLDENPEIEISVGDEERQATLGLRLMAPDDPSEFGDDEYDDDGRFDAWA